MTSTTDNDRSQHQDWLKKLDTLESKNNFLLFNKDEHESKSRLEITRLILKWYFRLVAGSFGFCFFYNCTIAFLNDSLECEPIPYLDVYNTVSIITASLTGIVGFVIGYYFKGKQDTH